MIRDVLERVGDKWSILLIGTLQNGPLRYTDLQKAIPGISQRMLTMTLHRMNRDGLVSRNSYAEVPPRVEYRLTPLGATLLETVLALAEWAVSHHREIEGSRARFDAASTG
jgi:DNA-binding HxlR family transcriptional regulator